MTKKEKMYKKWLDEAEFPKSVFLWDEMDSTRIMKIHGKNEENDFYFDVSYYDDATGEVWGTSREYMWDVVDTLVKFKVDLERECRF